MTNTETIAPARWVTANRTAKSGYDSLYELLRIDAPAAEVAELFETMTRVRGAHRVEVSRKPGSVVDGAYVESAWFSISFRGTDRAVHGAKNLLMLSGLQNLDENADHDHERCLAHARSLGVPASWAHRPETYLSS